VIADNPIVELLSAPLGPDWTVERLAEEVLCAIATRCARIRTGCRGDHRPPITPDNQTTSRLSREHVGFRIRNSPQPLRRSPLVSAARSRWTGVDSRPIREYSRDSEYHASQVVDPPTECRINHGTDPRHQWREPQRLTPRCIEVGPMAPSPSEPDNERTRPRYPQGD
jgi:hypothetical protein